MLGIIVQKEGIFDQLDIVGFFQIKYDVVVISDGLVRLPGLLVDVGFVVAALHFVSRGHWHRVREFQFPHTGHLRVEAVIRQVADFRFECV